MQNNHDSDTSYMFSDELYKVTEIDHTSIPPGFYRFQRHPQSRDLHLVDISMPQQDRYIETGSDRLEIEEDMFRFFQSEALYEDLDLAHRRGSLLYGPPGTGKTYSIIRAARRAMEELDVLVFLLHQDVRFDNLAKLRSYFSDRRTVFVFEEISRSAMTGHRASSDLLSFLDGELSWDRNYNIATTNYPGDLPGNLVDRPGRFDVLIEMGLPDASERRKFLNAYLDENAYSDRIVRRLDGFSLSYIKEMVLRSRLYDRPLIDIIDQFDEQKEKVKAAFDRTSEGLGFDPSDNGHSS